MSNEINPNLIIILVTGLLIFWYYNDKNSKNLEHRVRRPFKGAYSRKEFLSADPRNMEKTVEELLEKIDEIEEEKEELEIKIEALQSSEATSKEMIKYLNTNLNAHIDRTSH